MSIKFLTEANFGDLSEFNKIVIAPGRFNPPHRGHKLIIDKLVALGQKLRAEPVVLIIDSGKYGSRNPLTGEVRKEYLSKMFPKVRFEIFKNAYEAVYDLADKHKEVPVGGVTGADRGNAYKRMISKLFSKDVGDEYVSEVLHRDPDSDEIVGISASKVRDAAADNDIAKFRAHTGLDDEEARALIKLIVKGMNSGE